MNDIHRLRCDGLTASLCYHDYHSDEFIMLIWYLYRNVLERPYQPVESTCSMSHERKKCHTNKCINRYILHFSFAEENDWLRSYSQIKWKEWVSRQPLCTYSLQWARRTSLGWWDEWDDTVHQTQDLKFEPWRFEAEHATSRSARLPTILNHHEWSEKKHFVSLKLESQSGVRTHDLRLLSTSLDFPSRQLKPLHHGPRLAHAPLCGYESTPFHT